MVPFFNKDKIVKRILMSVIGVLISGFSVGLFKRSCFGVDPFQTFMNGVDAMIPISFGILYVIVNIILLVISIIFDRSKIGIATLINLFLLGYVVEFSEKLMWHLFPELNLVGRIIILVIGLIISCFAAAVYFTADLGVSTYDAVALILSQRVTKIPFKFWRIITDFCCVGIGVGLFILGTKLFHPENNLFTGLQAIVGVGTILTAFFMGPLISFFRQYVAEPFLYGKKDKKIEEKSETEGTDPSKE